jgi:3-phytase
VVGHAQPQGEPVRRGGARAHEARSVLSLAVLPAVLSAVIGCEAAGEAVTGAGTVPPSTPPAVAETWISEPSPSDNIDSLAFWSSEDGGSSWVIATAKEGNRLLIYDASTGALVRAVGSAGSELGQFLRPNGIAVHDDVVLVVERDNHRVQALRLPALEPIAVFGNRMLRRPYGLAVLPAAAGEIDVYVTDDYETPEGTVPPEAELGERIKVFRVRIEGGELTAEHVRSFGDTSGPGVLRVVESIAVDPGRERVLIAEEAAPGLSVKVYSLDGRFTGLVAGLGVFRHQPEGIAQLACGERAFWIVSDQSQERTVFRVLDSETLQERAAFTGERTANTDGIAVTSMGVGDLAAGVLWAVHDDQAVAALDWAAVAQRLQLNCA